MATVSVTVLPGLTEVPPAGDWESTVPSGLLVVCSSFSETLKPLPSSSPRASATVLPTTDGTATGCAPRETVRRTVLPFSAVEPSGGLEEITCPDLTSAE